jgi:hypothetical protein
VAGEEKTGKCIEPPARIAADHAKSLLNQVETSRFSVVVVLKKMTAQEMTIEITTEEKTAEETETEAGIETETEAGIETEVEIEVN